MVDTELADLAAWAETCLPRLIAAAHTATVERIPFYRDERIVPAEVLYCHPNTVRYRLRRLQELTGRSLSDPRGIAELAAAAYALRLNTATALWQGRQPSAAVNGRAVNGSTSDRASGRAQAPTNSGATTHPGQTGTRR